MTGPDARALLPKITPGPWEIDDRGSSIDIEANGNMVAQIDCSYDVTFDREQCLADARLIASAPDLLARHAQTVEALEHALDEAVDRWYNLLPHHDITLHDFLGLTFEQYARYVKDGAAGYIAALAADTDSQQAAT